jgi:hypothetical protein
MRSSRRIWNSAIVIPLAVLVILGTIKCGDDGKSFRPIIENLLCPAEGIEYGALAIFQWTGSDPDGQIVGYYYDLDDDTPETWTAASACTLTNVSVGAHLFFVQAEDDDGRRSQVVSCSFMVLEPGDECVVSPTSLDFGTVDLGSSADLSFTMTNNGAGALSGTIEESCDQYSIASGGGSYSLGAGESRTVTVRFEPASCGTHTCTIETGVEPCPDVSCAGQGGGTGCELTPSSLDFGDVDVGSSADLTFTLTNTGCTALNGTIAESCDHYALVSGGGPYSLSAGQSLTVTVRFTPKSPGGTHECTIETGLAGTPCSGVSCTGEGSGEYTECIVSPANLDFGTVDIGTSADRTFTITNGGTTRFPVP